MLPLSLRFVAVYLLLGFLASFLMRKGRAEDWDENLLASIVALPVVILITAAVLAQKALHAVADRSGPAAHA
jgi:hypothetical protein